MINIEDVKLGQCFVAASKNHNMFADKLQLIERSDKTILLRDVDKGGVATLDKLDRSDFNTRYVTADWKYKFEIIELI